MGTHSKHHNCIDIQKCTHKEREDAIEKQTDACTARTHHKQWVSERVQRHCSKNNNNYFRKQTEKWFHSSVLIAMHSQLYAHRTWTWYRSVWLKCLYAELDFQNCASFPIFSHQHGILFPPSYPNAWSAFSRRFFVHCNIFSSIYDLLKRKSQFFVHIFSVRAFFAPRVCVCKYFLFTRHVHSWLATICVHHFVPSYSTTQFKSLEMCAAVVIHFNAATQFVCMHFKTLSRCKNNSISWKSWPS